jgi:NAD(P)-dependent dehydrogenase (short-subunit alcohol dehydrogenase family)
MLENKVVVITGGLGLLGQSFAESILSNGGKVILADLINSNSDNIINKLTLKTGNSNAYSYELDITSKESILKLINYFEEKLGKIDAWVNNAFPRISKTTNEIKREYSNSFFDFEYDDLYESVGLNLGGTFLCSQQISKFFIKQGYGNIINIASIYGVISPRFDVYSSTGMTMPVDYAMIKAGTIHFTRYLAKYLRGKNIRVNTLSPGGVFNNQPESFVSSYKNYSLNKGMLDKEDIGGALLFLLSNNSEFVNGQNIVVDDGWTL